MCSWWVYAITILFAMGGAAQEHGPMFLLEPPARLQFSNSTGARVSCAAHGSPPPQLAWQLPDGTQLDDVPGLRQVLDNGTLSFLPFGALQYRQDVHSTVYRCRAHNSHGAVVSRDMRTQAVSDNGTLSFLPFGALQYRQDVHSTVYRCRAHNSHGAVVSRDMRTQAVSDNGTLSFLPFGALQYRQDVHSTVYRCRAHNSHGAVVSRDMRTQAVSDNGTLSFLPFGALQYRQDVHSTVYRCRAHNSHGAVVSRDMRTQAVSDNGTLSFLPFGALQYRQDVHSTVYRCRAHNSHGAVVSRDMRTQAVVWQEWDVHVSATPAAAGGPALLACVAPAAVREHASVAAWYRDDAVLSAGDHFSGPTLLVDEGWKLIVRSVRMEDSHAQYSCSVLDSLTGERRRSSPISIDVTPSSSSAPRALWGALWEASARRGGDAVLPCLAHADPPPAVT
ncbi:cell adhesion molecule Dscam2-like [Bicyclus anynana]|uniref:Cell adhesion molecule Dscam2-like n=1 Tax=Bicyclus anynana TaxID=110368 RepID=A0ABM3LG71_BICAN|nr:cell adhesion molecule Dscam2-like [Bicyclus anynana]